MSTNLLMSRLRPGDRFKLILGRDPVDLPFELVKFDGEFAVCKSLHPQLVSEAHSRLSVPGAMVRLIEEPNDAARNP